MTVGEMANALAKQGPLSDDIVEKLRALRIDIDDSWCTSLDVPLSELISKIGESRKDAEGKADAKFKEAYGSAVEARNLLFLYRFDDFRMSFDWASVLFTQALGIQLQGRIPEGRAGAGTDWDDVRNALGDLAEAKDPRDAEAHYGQAQTAYRKANVAAGGAVGIGAADNFRLETTPPKVLPHVTQSRIHYPLDAPRESDVALRYKVRNISALVDLVAVVATGLLGVVVVWLGDRDWGTASDLAAAFLWGMGLHTIGTATATNVTAMLARVRA